MRTIPVLALLAALAAPPAGAAEPLGRPVNLWPLYYRRPLPDGVETEALFWLYAHSRAGAASTTLVRPLFRHERSPERLASRLFPLYDYRREAGRRSLGLVGLSPFTLGAFERDGTRASRRVLFWRQARDPSGSLLELPPLWAAARGPGGARRVSALGAPDALNLFERRLEPSRGLVEWHALTVWSRVSPDDRYLHVWPFYGVRRQGTRTERSTLWPLAAAASDPARGLRARRFWPLFAVSGAELDDEPPSDLALNLSLPAPLWYRVRTKDRLYRRFLFLHWAASTPERRTHVTVPWYSFAGVHSGVRHRGLFPLYHGSRWDGRALDLAPPLYFSWRDAESRLSVLFPFYYGHAGGGRSFDYWFPLYGRTVRDGVVTRRFLLFPLYARRAEPGLRELDLLWPLFHLERSSGSAATRALPLYWSARSGQDSFTLAPLYARVARGEETRSVLFPVYWRLSAGRRDARFLPPLGGLVRDAGERDLFAAGFTPELSLLRSARGPEYSLDRALLWYRRREPRTAADAVFPVYFRWSDPVERGLVLFPLYAAQDDLSGGARRRAVLGLTGGLSLFEWSTEPAANGRRVRALLYSHASRGEERSTVLAPLYWRFVRGASARTWLLPLYAERREAGSRARGFLGVSPRWSVLSRTEENGATETRFLWRLVRLRRGPDDGAFEFNPLFFTLREGERRYSAFLGGLVGFESGPEGRRWRWLWVL